MKEFSSIVTTDSSAFRARNRLFLLTFLFEVKDWITVSSVKGYRLLSYSFLSLSTKKILYTLQ